MSRLRALYARYHDRHYHLDCAGGRLPGPAGYLDRLRRAGNTWILEGWTEAASISARCGGTRVATLPGLPRQDVAAALGRSADVGFHLEIAGAPARPILRISDGSEGWTYVPPLPPRRHRLAAELRVLSRFVRDLLRAAPHVPRAILTAAPEARAKVKARLRLGPAAAPNRLEHRLFDVEGVPPTPKLGPITIVMPVYNAFEMVRASLDRLANHTDLPWHAVVVEDASSDSRVRPYLRAWAAQHGPQVTLLENAQNLGFIGAANRGLSVAITRGNHVVLLNSDAFVPPDWASRLMRPMARHRNVASVTPMSNDATILSAPVIGRRSDIGAGAADAADQVARRFNPEACLSVLPTGIGFCMAMNIDYLCRVPRFDPAFGRGYGEEVDWCQKVRALGGRHLGLPGLFVEHRGGGSFGSEAKRALIRRNNRRISARYPSYDAEVQRMLATDPMRTPRLALGIALAAAASRRPLPIYVAHSLGGGAEFYLKRRIAGDLLGGPAAIVLRVGGARRWRIELHSEDGITVGETDEFGFVQDLLAPISARNIVYSCGVGDPDPTALPGALCALKRPGGADRLDVLFHDYFPLSPSYTLLDADRRYRGPVAVDRADTAHRAIRPDGTIVPLSGWRAAWGRVIETADRLVVFSEDSRDHVLRIYPGAADRIAVRPHTLTHRITPLTPPAGRKQVIGILGNIGVQKGASVIAALAQRIEGRDDLSLALIGNLDPAFALPRRVPVSGDYASGDIGRLAAAYGVTRWLIPSIWPETFSFTTYEALATGLPVHAFHIGNQGAAVARAENGVPIHFDADANLVELILSSLAGDAARVAA